MYICIYIYIYIYIQVGDSLLERRRRRSTGKIDLLDNIIFFRLLMAIRKHDPNIIEPVRHEWMIINLIR